MEPSTGVDYYLTLTLCRLQHIYNGKPYAIVDLNLMPGSTLTTQSGTKNLASGKPGLYYHSYR